MEIVYTEGCIATGIEIDGKDYQNLSYEEKLEVLNKITKYIRNHPDYIQNLIEDVAPWFGEYQDLGTCEQCGDSIDRYTLDLDEKPKDYLN